EPLGIRDPRKHRKQHQQQRTEATRSKPGDEPPTRVADAGWFEPRKKNGGAGGERDHRESERTTVDRSEAHPDQRDAKGNERKQEKHLRARFAIVEKAITELDIERGDDETGRERSKKTAPANGLRCRVRGERYAERV